MSRDVLPYPPQMRNGGSPPAHLSSPYLSNPSWWLQFKWSQSPPRAPEWLFDYYKSYNPPANVGQPLPNDQWCQRAFCDDQQAAGLLPPEYGGPILHGACARADRACRDWKAAVNDLWADEYEALLVEQAACTRQEEAAHRQWLLDEHAAHARQQETARQEALCAAQRLLHERAAHERQVEAAHRQRLLDEETARRRRATQARQTAAARVIFLWLCRQLLFTRLAHQTSRRLQREAALVAAEQAASEFATFMASLRADMAKRHHEAAARAAEALALVEERCRHEAVLAAEADDRRHHEAAARALEALALVEKGCCHDAVLAAEADDRRRHEAAARAAEALALVEERCRHEAVLAAEADN